MNSCVGSQWISSSTVPCRHCTTMSLWNAASCISQSLLFPFYLFLSLYLKVSWMKCITIHCLFNLALQLTSHQDTTCFSQPAIRHWQALCRKKKRSPKTMHLTRVKSLISLVNDQVEDARSTLNISKTSPNDISPFRKGRLVWWKRYFNAYTHVQYGYLTSSLPLS